METYPERLMTRLRQAFLDRGYEHVSMVGLAEACGVSRRSLYNYFSSKEEAFRGVLRWRHAQEIDAGLEAGRYAIAEGVSALDAIVAVFDARYGAARRDLERSPHALEINREAFRHAGDVMSDSAAVFHSRLGAFLEELAELGKLDLRSSFSPLEVAELLADGARGVNQTLPRRPASTLPERYRRMCEAVLYGAASPKG
jgi:AcrR family transcriptional regulator